MAGHNSDNATPNPPGRQPGRARLPWHRDPVVLARMVQVERRRLAGEHNTTIAAALAVDEKTIRDDIKRIESIWLERIGQDIEALKAEKVAELGEIKRLALDAAAFDGLCERAVLFGIEVGLEDGTKVRVKRDDKGSAQFRGNKAAAIGQARQAIMDQAKVLGLVVEKVAPTDGKGTDLDLAGLLQKARDLRASQSEAAGVGAGAA